MSSKRTNESGPRRRNRRGTLYFAVLGVTMIVGVVALTAATVARLELKRAAGRGDRREARLLAQSGLEHCLNYIEQNSGWRDDFNSGVETTPTALGGGTVAWVLTDEDGDLADDDTDPVTVRGVGRVGGAIAVEQVSLEARGPALDSLAVALHCEGDINVSGGTVLSWRNLRTNQTISSNGDINAGGAFNEVFGNAWATGTITGNVSGVSQPGQSPAREMPGSGVFDYYVANGAPIDITTLPGAGGVKRIDKTLLSAASNPHGAVNAEGIYVIDCQGQSLEINTGRILGTIVLLDNGPDTAISGRICWEPAVPGYPALLVEKDLRLEISSFGPSEEVDSVNYNPVGTPYNGVEDDDSEDNLLPRMWGLIYVGGKLTVDNLLGPTVVGTVVCKELELDSRSTFNYDSASYENPPPGFQQGASGLGVQRGSWVRAAY